MTPILIPLFIHVTGCSPYPDGLRLTPDGSGPTVVIDWDAKPLPEIPLPNDLATRPDPSSVTGLRLNISEEALTGDGTRSSSEKIGLAGFGIYAPFTVSFDRPLDLDEIQAPSSRRWKLRRRCVLAHQRGASSPDYLQPVRLDVGHGRFPQDLDETDRYFPNDPRQDSPALLFETVDEDLNRNGISIREKTPTMTASSTFRTSGPRAVTRGKTS